MDDPIRAIYFELRATPLSNGVGLTARNSYRPRIVGDAAPYAGRLLDLERSGVCTRTAPLEDEHLASIRQRE